MLLFLIRGRWRNHLAPFVFSSLVVCLFFNSPIRAETIRLSLEELTREADAIVRGRIQKVTQQTADLSNITTDIEISVVEQWKGPKASSLVLSQPGGSAGEITQAVPGLPQFSAAEDAILFLKESRGGFFEMVGGRQGKFVVKTDPQSGKEFIQDLTGKTQTLSDFLIRLKAALR